MLYLCRKAKQCSCLSFVYAKQNSIVRNVLILVTKAKTNISQPLNHMNLQVRESMRTSLHQLREIRGAEPT